MARNPTKMDGFSQNCRQEIVLPVVKSVDLSNLSTEGPVKPILNPKKILNASWCFFLFAEMLSTKHTFRLLADCQEKQ